VLSSPPVPTPVPVNKIGSLSAPPAATAPARPAESVDPLAVPLAAGKQAVPLVPDRPQAMQAEKSKLATRGKGGTKKSANLPDPKQPPPDWAAGKVGRKPSLKGKGGKAAMDDLFDDVGKK
jgi:hypothetical protein